MSPHQTALVRQPLLTTTEVVAFAIQAKEQLSREAEAPALFAGVNSIFAGTKLLTTQNAAPSDDNVSLAGLQGNLSPKAKTSREHTLGSSDEEVCKA